MKKIFATTLIVTLLVLTGILTNPFKARAGYTYSRTVTTTHTSVPSTQTSFTILVCANSTMGNGNTCGTVAGLNQSGGGAHVQNSNGYDIVFSTATDCSSGLLNWEMEKYVAATGEMYAWVKISSLSSSADNVIYMCYGNSAISTFQGGSVGSAWDSNYQGIWHMPDGSSLSATDSSTHSNNGTINSALATSGQIDGAASTTAGSEVSIPNNSSIQVLGGDFTISAWWYANANFNYSAVFDKSTTGGSGRALSLLIQDTGHTYAGIGGQDFVITTSGYSTNAWHYSVITRSGTALKIYLDGAANGTAVSAGTTDSGNALSFGKNTSGGGSNWSGQIDEGRIENSLRSPNWITAEYNNQSAPGSFITFGSETTNGGAAISPAHARVILIKGSAIIKGRVIY